MGWLAVLATRILVPLTILRWPFVGILLAIGADLADKAFLDSFGAGGASPETYQLLDKAFDLWHLALAFVVSRRWEEAGPRKMAAGFFFLRLGGVALFELSRIRSVLFFAPNIFEPFFLLVSGLKQFAPLSLRNPRVLFAVVFFAVFPKLIHEYIMHVVGFPLGIANSWAFIKESFLQ